MEKIRVGLYGSNGHQIQRKLVHHPDAELAALCMTKEAHLPDATVPVYSSLEDMLRDESLTLISLCSPRRADQAADAIACLNAGKHVYAEKPSALDENELNRIFDAADAAGCEFHEMADSIFYEPYWTVRSVVQSGKIGEVIQVYAQKSYPSRFDSRPQDEETDGGLIRWVGIHAVRFIEHITGIHVRDVRTYETHLGGPLKDDGIYTAASMAMSLENGGVASVVLNYLNPTGFPSWGNETVRVFGRCGMVELTDGGRRTHLYTDRDEGELEIPEVPCADYFDLLVRHLRFGSPFPLSRDDEFHPLRVVLRAKERAEKCEIR